MASSEMCLAAAADAHLAFAARDVARDILERDGMRDRYAPLEGAFQELHDSGVHFIAPPEDSIPASTPRFYIVSNWNRICGCGDIIVGALYDALLMAKAYRSLGFEVLFQQNVSSSEVYDACGGWLIRADHAGFYFAGHGGSYKGSQILAAPSRNPHDRGQDAMKESTIKLLDLIVLLNTPEKTRMLLIDCCRDSNLSPDIKPQVAAQLPMKGMYISTAALCGQVVAELKLSDIEKYADREPDLKSSMPKLGEYIAECASKGYTDMRHSTYSLFLAMRLMQSADTGVIQLMRQMRNDSMCILAYQQAEMLCRSLKKTGEPQGLPGGITIPLDVCSWDQDLTMLGKPTPDTGSSLVVLPSSHDVPIIALVIGNEVYDDASVKSLPGAARDAKAMAATLRALNVKVTEKHNLKGSQILSAVADFARESEASGSDVRALIFYSGHGFQIKGHNILAGVDIKTEDLSPDAIGGIDIPNGTAPLTEILNDALSSVSRLALIIDACRDDPFAQYRSLGKPLETSSLAVPTVEIVENLISAKNNYAAMLANSSPTEMAKTLVRNQSRGKYLQMGSSAMAKDFFTLFSASPAECASDQASYTQTLLKEIKSPDALRDLQYVAMRASKEFVAKQGAWSPPANGKQNKQVPWALSILHSSLNLPLCTPEIQAQLTEEETKATTASMKSLAASLSPEQLAALLPQLAKMANAAATPAVEAPATEAPISVSEPAAKVAKHD